ncbi:hypothetical protein [Nocardia sp. NPDC050718]|uniref:hypothetical protein n=1 Tax=Nocardia sp. NPDC050718 TaxID=3155788 RepID=UPI0033E0AA5C
MGSTTSNRSGIVVALLVGLLAGGYLGALFASSADSDPPRRTSTARDVEHAEPVVFESDRGLPDVHTILRSQADIDQFVGRFPGDGSGRLADQLSRRDLGSEALLAFSWGAGCSPGDGAKLTTQGTADYSVRLTGADNPPPECAAPWDILAVFALPRDEVPPDTRLGGDRPDPPGPATLAHVERITLGAALRGAEVSQPDQLAAFTAGLDATVAHRVNSVVSQRAARDRAFAFVLTGCHNDGAYLAFSAERLRPVLTATEPVVCVVPDYYVAVFTAPAASVPVRATIG